MGVVTQYALVDQNNIVQNIILWDGQAPINVPGGWSVPLATSNCGIGYTYNPGNGSFTFGQTQAQIQAANEQTLNAQVAGAIARLEQIQTQAATFISEAQYTTANLANLQDLQSKAQLIAQAVSDMASDMVAVARILSNQFNGTS